MQDTKENRDKLDNRPLSRAVNSRKEELYEKVPLTVKQLDVIIGVAVAALVIVFILIALEAAGIYSL